MRKVVGQRRDLTSSAVIGCPLDFSRPVGVGVWDCGVDLRLTCSLTVLSFSFSFPPIYLLCGH